MTKTLDLNSDFLEDYPVMMTVEQVSELLGRHRESCYRMVRNGVFKKVLRLGREIRIPKKQVEEYIINNLETF